MTDLRPKNALDPRVMLATSIHAQPGVYALLIGSGVSTGAGIPTGWGVIKELVARCAAALDPGDVSAAAIAFEDPEAWWAEHGDGSELGYSGLLAALAPTPAARRALLAGFFEPSEDDVEENDKVPSAAHRAIAALVKRGTIRVILTTNFDRLLERALEDEGVSPQVISHTGALAGMSPLQHSPATIIKLHGDYSDLLMRNTADELGTYPDEWNALLDRVLDEYGLLIAGWSADWDTALVAAIERMPNRRYPLFWDSRSGKGGAARRLLALQRGIVVTADDADQLFTGLRGQIEALDRIAEPPVTTAIAIQRLKKYLPDVRRRIDLHDLVMDQTDKVAAFVGVQPVSAQGQLTYEDIQKLIDSYVAAADPLIRLTLVGVQHDVDGRFDSLWIEALQRLLNARTRWDGQSNSVLEQLRHLPALLYMRSAVASAVRFKREGLAFRLLGEPSWKSQFEQQAEPAGYVLYEYQLLDGGIVNGLPGSDGSKWLYPPSHLLRELLRDSWTDLAAGEDYTLLADDYEWRVSLFLHSLTRRVMPGEFILDSRWSHDDGLISATRFRELVNRTVEPGSWDAAFDGRESLITAVGEVVEELKPLRRWG